MCWLYIWAHLNGKPVFRVSKLHWLIVVTDISLTFSRRSSSTIVIIHTRNETHIWRSLEMYGEFGRHEQMSSTIRILSFEIYIRDGERWVVDTFHTRNWSDFPHYSTTNPTERAHKGRTKIISPLFSNLFLTVWHCRI